MTTATLKLNSRAVGEDPKELAAFLNKELIPVVKGLRTGIDNLAGDVTGTAAASVVTLAGDVTGRVGVTVVGKIQGNPVAATTPIIYQQLASPDGAGWAPAYQGLPLGVAPVAFSASIAAVDSSIALPSSPTGGFVVSLPLLWLSAAIVGAGTVTLRMGTTQGGNEIMTDQALTSANVVGEKVSLSLAKVGTAITAANRYTLAMAAGATIWVRATTSAAVITAGGARLGVFALQAQ